MFFKVECSSGVLDLFLLKDRGNNMAIPKTIDVCREHLFTDKSELIRLAIPEIIIDRLLRIRDVYNKWLATPSYKDGDIVALLIQTYDVSRSTAYADVKIIKTLLGDMNRSTRDYHRWQFNEQIREAMELARNKGDLKSLVQALDKYAKYNKLDQEDVREIPWDEIIPQPFTPTSDPTVIGIKPIPNIQERIAEKKRQYWNEDMEDVEAEEIDLGEGLEMELKEKEKDYARTQEKL